MATPQDNIIETLEAEIVRLKAQLSDTEDRLSKMKEKNDEMAIKLYGGRRTWCMAIYFDSMEIIDRVYYKKPLIW